MTQILNTYHQRLKIEFTKKLKLFQNVYVHACIHIVKNFVLKITTVFNPRKDHNSTNIKKKSKHYLQYYVATRTLKNVQLLFQAQRIPLRGQIRQLLFSQDYFVKITHLITVIVKQSIVDLDLPQINQQKIYYQEQKSEIQRKQFSNFNNIDLKIYFGKDLAPPKCLLCWCHVRLEPPSLRLYGLQNNNLYNKKHFVLQQVLHYNGFFYQRKNSQQVVHLERFHKYPLQPSQGFEISGTI
eukprot:TRINITY_DN1080_c0_g2_i3.p2 TRINITY_DN1080_c0_g2~~TRINITY_DN1080_c0_g2_i3.p2  ORF type:complete len:240 (+),score=-7.28 TRINITY_DN1080_c0_g2_i3:657-1376(+)